MKISDLVICFVLKGVFCDEVKSLMEGDSVLLNCEFPIQKYELILWTFGPDSTRIAQINKVVKKISLYDDVLNGKFKDRLKLDDQTGSLTITNMSSEHAGLYELKIFGGNEDFSKKFRVIVYADLPVPVISRDSSQCSSSSSLHNCSAVCSVANVSHVTLSWLKGNSVLSSISVSEYSVSLSLPLEVEYEDRNNYICVVNTTITHQTAHLDISRLCQSCEVDASHAEKGLPFSHVVLICGITLIVLTFFAVVGMITIYLKIRKINRARENQHELNEMNNGDALAETYALKMISASLGESVTLNTGVTKINTCDVLQWRFAELNTDKTNPFVVFARLNEPKMYNFKGHDNSSRDRIHLDRQTGFLTIKDIRPRDFGIYKVNITRNKRTVISKTFLVLDSSEISDVSEKNTLLNREEITSL